MNTGFGAGREPGERLKSRVNWYDYGARFYDPSLGRWHVIDPAVENNHHNYTPYAYVYNNPLLFIDPFGLDSALCVSRNDNVITVKMGSSVADDTDYEVEIVLGSNVKQDHITDKSAKVVGEAMVESGDTKVVVSSGYRDPENQARVMYDNIEKYGTEYNYKLYGSGGDKVIDSYVGAKGKTDKQGYLIHGPVGVKGEMERTIKQVGGRRVSAHASDPNVHNVFDIAPSSVNDVSSFHKVLKADTRVHKVLSPVSKPKDPGVHIEIPQ